MRGRICRVILCCSRSQQWNESGAENVINTDIKKNHMRGESLRPTPALSGLTKSKCTLLKHIF